MKERRPAELIRRAPTRSLAPARQQRQAHDEFGAGNLFAPVTFAPNATGVQVKICGLTNEEDACAAIATGADALGFNFYPGSARALDPDRDFDWIRRLPRPIQRVAVAVNPDRALVDRLLATGAIDLIQLHGDESEAFCAELRAAGIPFVKAIRVRDAASLERLERFGSPAILLDAYRGDAFGGTGHRLDWTLARRLVDEGQYSVILAGGLTPENVAEAIAEVRPAGVDVASGLERPGEPRRKDPARMAAFFAAVRQARTLIAQS